MRMLKRCIAALCAAAAVVLLSGCTKTADVNLRLVVHAVGIDVDEDGIYTVSAQVFSAQPPDGGGPVEAETARRKQISAGRSGPVPVKRTFPGLGAAGKYGAESFHRCAYFLLPFL